MGGGPGRHVTMGQNEAFLSRSVHLHSEESRVSKSVENAGGHEEAIVNNIYTRYKKRGRTRNVALSKRRNVRENLRIDIPTEVGRIVGVNSQFAITEAGCLTRRFAPLQATKWAKIEEDKKLGLLRDFKGSFSCGESLMADRVIFSQMNTQYRNYRHKLYKNYFLKGITPAHVDSEDWEYLCTYFASEEYQRISKRNATNRAVQNTQHIAGSKPFAQICREWEDKNKEVLGPIELYKLTHYRNQEGSEEGCWISEIAEHNYEKMVEYRTEKEETGESPIDEEQICDDILGYKSGYIRGRGAGTKPSRSVARNMYREELEEAKRNAKNAQERAGNAEQQVLVFSEQLEDQKSVIEELKEGLAATQRAMLESQKCTSEMMAFFQKFRQPSHLSTSPRSFDGAPELRELFREVARY